MNRRSFLMAAAALPGAAASGGASASALIHTATGPVAPDRLGLTLIHEHLLVDFVGADQVSADRYEVEEVVRVALPHLRAARRAGVRTLVECTPDFLGRDPLLLRRLSRESGVLLLTNTGYYGAGGGRFLPEYARTESPEQLAGRWIVEAHGGIAGTGIRPAFIKIGVDGAPLPGVNRSLVKAAALTHLATGLPIHQHSGSGAAALEALEILRSERVPADAFVWVHAQAEPDAALHREAARRGAWVEFDGIAPGSVEQHVELVVRMREADLLGRVLVSHDAGWYHVGEPEGGTFRGFATLFNEFLPALRRSGCTEEEERRLLIANPRRVLTPRRTSGASAD
jgi:predicted metal-dependent phosphotriesterase family hydrolase